MNEIEQLYRRNNRYNWLYRMSVFTLILFSGIILLVTYWLFFPYKTVIFNDSVFPVKNKVVKVGDNLVYTSNYCKYADFSALVTRTFVNELIFSVPSIITNRPMGCHMISVQVNVPQELPAGKYHLENIYTIQVNPLRIITIKENTEDFTVVRP